MYETHPNILVDAVVHSFEEHPELREKMYRYCFMGEVQVQAFFLEVLERMKGDPSICVELGAFLLKKIPKKEHEAMQLLHSSKKYFTSEGKEDPRALKLLSTIAYEEYRPLHREAEPVLNSVKLYAYGAKDVQKIWDEHPAELDALKNAMEHLRESLRKDYARKDLFSALPTHNRLVALAWDSRRLSPQKALDLFTNILATYDRVTVTTGSADDQKLRTLKSNTINRLEEVYTAMGNAERAQEMNALFKKLRPSTKPATPKDPSR